MVGIYVILFVCLVALPTVYLLKTSPIVARLVRGVGFFVTILGTVGVLFGTKVYRIYTRKTAVESYGAANQGASSNGAVSNPSEQQMQAQASNKSSVVSVGRNQGSPTRDSQRQNQRHSVNASEATSDQNLVRRRADGTDSCSSLVNGAKSNPPKPSSEKAVPSQRNSTQLFAVRINSTENLLPKPDMVCQNVSETTVGRVPE